MHQDEIEKDRVELSSALHNVDGYTYVTNTDEQNQTQKIDLSENEFEYLDQNGNSTKESRGDNIWAYSIKNSTENAFYIKTSGGRLCHHIIAPPRMNMGKFQKCSEDIFNQYKAYLSEKSEVSYKSAQREFQLQGYSS